MVGEERSYDYLKREILKSTSNENPMCSAKNGLSKKKVADIFTAFVFESSNFKPHSII